MARPHLQIFLFFLGSFESEMSEARAKSAESRRMTSKCSDSAPRFCPRSEQGANAALYLALASLFRNCPGGTSSAQNRRHTPHSVQPWCCDSISSFSFPRRRIPSKAHSKDCCIRLTSSAMSYCNEAAVPSAGHKSTQRVEVGRSVRVVWKGRIYASSHRGHGGPEPR